SDSLRTVVFAPDGHSVAAAGKDRVIRIVELANGTVRTLSGHDDTVYSLAFSPDGALVASGSWDKTVRLSNLASAASTVLRGHTSADAIRVQFSPDGRVLASQQDGPDDGTAIMWDVTTGARLSSIGERYPSILSADLSSVARGGNNGKLELVDVGT